MTRGFVTLATGDDYYYQIARTLLRSFKIRNSERFAILCDRENEYTKEFDDVIILKNVTGSYLDKFRLFVDCPYDENIFIETDCIIYRDLTPFWNYLSKEYDFTCFGWTEGSLSTYFEELKDEVIERYYNGDTENAYLPCFCPAYLFIRNGETCRKIYKDLIEISSWLETKARKYDSNLLICKGVLRDDPVIQLSMIKNGCRCTYTPDVGKCMFLPTAKKIKQISVLNGKLDVVYDKFYEDCNLLHFSTKRCREEGLYWQQSISVNLIHNGKSVFLIRLIESSIFGGMLNAIKKVKVFIHKSASKLKR